MIRFASFLGDNAFEFYRRVVAYLGEQTGLPTELVSGLTLAKQEALVQREEIQVVFTCGLPYVRKADHSPPLLRLMAAPIMADDRYQGRPVYFSEVIVPAGAPYHNFADLRGTTFAYNEVHSLSGYLFVRHHLAQLGENPGFFGEWRASGSHAHSMDLVEQGSVAAATIDSVVLAMELAQHPARAAAFRVVERLGPYPMPPVAAVTGLAAQIHKRLTQALITMSHSSHGWAILAKAGVKCFAPVVDEDYHPIRRIIQALQLTGSQPSL
jgi:phosphonate transport system substrate-binding protein